MPNNTIPIFANSELTSQQDIENLMVYTTPLGEVVRLSDVAKINRTYSDLTSFIRMGDDKVMMLAIEMQSGNNIVQFGDLINKKLEEIGKTLPEDVKIDTIVSQPGSSRFKCVSLYDRVYDGDCSLCDSSGLVTSI